MCGRYFIDKETILMIEEWLADPQEEIKTGDVFPGDRALVITKNKARAMFWGYPFKKRLLINARAESVRTKPTFKEAIRKRRCLIPCAHFYEWNAQKEKVSFSLKSRQPIFMAGLYESFDDGDHFTIITTDANASVSPVHHRMPLILTGRQMNLWLEEGTAYRDFLKMPEVSLVRRQAYQQLSIFEEE